MDQTEITDAIAKARTIPWGAGKHAPKSGMACIAEAIAFATGAPWSDAPPCWPREISLLAQKVHDNAEPDEWASVWTDERLAAMFRAAHGDDAARRRAYMAAEHARASAVRGLQARGCDTSEIDACPVICDRATATRAERSLRNAAAYAAYAAGAAAYAAYADAAHVDADDAAADYAAGAAAYAAYADAAHVDADDAAAAADYAAGAAAAAAADGAAYAAAARQSARIAVLDQWCAA